MILQWTAQRCLRRTGIGWSGSGGGPTDTRLSSAAVRRWRTSASRDEFGDLGRIFTAWATFVFPSLRKGTRCGRRTLSFKRKWLSVGQPIRWGTHSWMYGADGGGGMYKSKMAVFPLVPGASEDSGCRDLYRPGAPWEVWMKEKQIKLKSRASEANNIPETAPHPSMCWVRSALLQHCQQRRRWSSWETSVFPSTGASLNSFSALFMCQKPIRRIFRCRRNVILCWLKRSQPADGWHVLYHHEPSLVFNCWFWSFNRICGHNQAV